MSSEIKIDKIIDVYIDSKLPETKSEEDIVKDLLKKQILSDITNSIVREERDRIVNEAEVEIDKRNQNKKKIAMKVILMETIFLGFLIGLLVNQGTDLITFIKGGNIDIMKTLICIVILVGLSLTFTFLMYISKLDELFNKKYEKH
ncbi:MAG: hypothetical protein ACLTUN_06285 [Paraclostridium sordellii]